MKKQESKAGKWYKEHQKFPPWPNKNVQIEQKLSHLNEKLCPMSVLFFHFLKYKIV